MELNKTVAAVLLAGIIAMASGFIAKLVVSPHMPEANAYSVAVGGEAATVAAGPEGAPPILGMLAEADVAAGEALTRACTACHSFEEGGGNKVGPNNWGVVGRPIASVADFNYSDAMHAFGADGEVWTYQHLNEFLYRPRDDVPGTTMSYAGMRNDTDRANLIAWLRTMSSDPVPLPTAEEIAAAEAAYYGAEEEVEASEPDAATEAAQDAAVEEQEETEVPQPMDGESAVTPEQPEAGAVETGEAQSDEIQPTVPEAQEEQPTADDESKGESMETEGAPEKPAGQSSTQ